MIPSLRQKPLWIRAMGLAAVVCGIWGSGSGAAEPVFLRGYRVTPDSIVFGTVESVNGGSAVLNLGSAHGMRPGQELLVVRTVLNQVMPLGGVMVQASDEDSSRARVAGPFRAQPGDMVLIHASRMKLWSSVPRLEQLLQNRLARRVTARGYSTIDASPRLIDEVARDDAFQSLQFTKPQEGSFIRESARKLGPEEARMGAFLPIRQLDNRVEQELPPERIPPEDATIERLGEFADLLRTPDKLRDAMSMERLKRLAPLDPAFEVVDRNATLTRDVLMTWINKTLTRAP